MSDANGNTNVAEGTATPANPSGAKEPRYDPMDPFRTLRDSYLNTFAKTMSEVTNTEAYAKANGAMLDSYLSVAGPYKEALDKSMVQALEQLSLPSRQDLISLAERFTNLELRMDDLDTKLDQILLAIKANGAAPVSASEPVNSAAAAPDAPSAP